MLPGQKEKGHVEIPIDGVDGRGILEKICYDLKIRENQKIEVDINNGP
jgi:hypothetical protein